MQNQNATHLLIEKSNLRNTRFTETKLPDSSELGDNQLLLRIDLFSFTANNITYAAVGESMHYWDFFPAEEGWGKVPCWGFADVVLSNCPDIMEGERLYGYFPMSSHLIVEAGKVNDLSFYDISKHRLSLPIVYNHYIRTQNDPGYQKQYEALHSIFQPLFATSFLLDDYLYEKHFFNAKQIISTSASSKTAIAFAHLLFHHRADRNADYKIIALTSSANAEFVKSLGLYDDIYTYDSIQSIPHQASMVVDFAGNKKVLLDLQDFLEAEDPENGLQYICNVGLSHWEDSSGKGSLRIPNEFFFAPSQAEKRTRDWGGNGLRKKMGAGFIPFLQFASKWMDIRKGSGRSEVETVYDEMIEGKVNPAEGIVLSLDV